MCVWWGTALSPPWKQGTQPPEPICKLPGPRTPAHLPTCPICRKGWRGQEVKEGSSSRARWEGRLQESWGLRAELWVPSPLKLRPTFNYPLVCRNTGYAIFKEQKAIPFEDTWFKASASSPLKLSQTLTSMPDATTLCPSQSSELPRGHHRISRASVRPVSCA